MVTLTDASGGMSRAAIPLALTLLRVLLAPVIVLLAVYHAPPAAFAACLLAAALSDYFDGALARRFKVVTTTLRRLDSIADTIFTLAALLAVWLLHPAIIHEHAYALSALFTLEALRYAYDFAKFGREASYHMWSSKLWGLTLVIAFFAVLVFGGGSTATGVAIAFGILADIEGLAISTLLPEWRNDVPTVVHALGVRRSWQGARVA